MEDTNKVYRIRTTVGTEAPNVIHVPLNQTYDMFEILSLKLNQTNSYKTYESDYGVIVGRVIANGGFGVPNAKVSVFISVSDDEEIKDKILYNFTSTSSTNYDGVRYNLLPDFVDDACHQDVGTFPNKRLVLDNQDVIEMFDKYWKYTTTTNHAGDYMLFGIPVGSQTLHCDVDLSDCGILSQRPRDMIGKGYNANMFESPNKFKKSTNLNSLAQIVSQDRGVYVYPYWGDVSDGDDNFSITRCDISLEYKFESYAVFIGCIVTDKGSNAIGKNCTGTEQNGNMSDLIAGEGTIEMIRKTIDGKVEEYPIMGNRLIDGDGVWCYQIPMNLDYVTTDEFGNLVPTDDPEKGIATRTRVRFRVTLDDNPNDATARKRARYLVPNNPRIGDEEFDEVLKPDYDFGTATREDSFCDMFWNKVYTVKNYIPKIQKNSKETNRKHSGIKLINHYGDNNPMPYNALTIKLSFTYRLICVIVNIFILLISFLNNLISILGYIPCWLGKKCIKIARWKICPFGFLLKLIPSCIELSSDFCDDGINPNVYYPGCGKPFDCVWKDKTRPECQAEQASKDKEDQKICTNRSAELHTCVENELAQKNDATSFNFYNDWVNGVLYAPLWYRKIRAKRTYFFGLFKRKAKDEWCSADHEFGSLRIMQTCSVVRDKGGDSYKNYDGTKTITPYYHEDDKKSTSQCRKSECNKSIRNVKTNYGLIKSKETMLGQTVYYYKPIEYDVTLHENDNLVKEGKPEGEIKLLFATDIVLLGSLNECDLNGVPQFFKNLESTTYNLPSDILFTDHEIKNEFDADGNLIETTYTETSEMAGCDWGNKNEYGKADGGLFYSIGCSDITMTEKSCVNLTRICEFGVSLDETRQVPDLSQLEDKGDAAFTSLVTDGFVSYDELYNLDERSMFATMNGNRLKTVLKNGLKEYDFRYLYPENFDGSLKKIMEDRTKRYDSVVTYRNNYKLEEFSRDYYKFRMGDAPYYYDEERTFARYENSFYFYFGLKAGKTAIEKFNSKYFAECFNPETIQNQVGITYEPNSWCSQINEQCPDGYLALDLSNLSTPFDLLINGVTYSDFSVEVKEILHDKIYISSYVNQTLEDKGYVQLKVKNDVYNDGGDIVEMLKNGAYIASVVDADGNITEFNFNIDNLYVSFKTDIQDFTQPNNTLGDNYCDIANNVDGLNVNSETKQVTRDIGGVISIYDIYCDNRKVENYKVEIRPEKPLANYEGSGFDNNGNTFGCGVITNENEIYGIGVPKGGMKYNITVTELCNGYKFYECLGNQYEPINEDDLKFKTTVPTSNSGKYICIVETDEDEETVTLYMWDEVQNKYVEQNYTDYDETQTSCVGGIVLEKYLVDSDNTTTTTVFVDEPLPFKMFINDVDYELIKNFNKIGTVYTDGWIPNGNIQNGNATLQDPNRSVVYEDNPWFKTANVWSNHIFKNVSNIEPFVFVEKDSLPMYYEQGQDFIKLTEPISYIKDSDPTVIITSEQYENLSETEKSEYREIMFYKWFESDDPNIESGYLPYDIINEINNKTIEFTDSDNNTSISLLQILDEFTKEVVDVVDEKVYYTWSGDYLLDDYDTNTFSVYGSNGEVLYDNSNINNIINVLNQFIEDVNNVIYLRNEIPSLMQDAFYLTCNNTQKTVNITVQTSDMPYKTTLVYQEETTIEDEEENTLNTNDMSITYESNVSNINIPTITYSSSDRFGISGATDYKPCVSQVNGYKKHAFYVGTVNDRGNTLPQGLIVAQDSNELKMIDESANQLSVLFDFPIIDKILNIDYISWSYFNNIPYYGKYDENSHLVVDTVSMNGLLASHILNGNVINNMFDTQTLCGLDLMLSDNMVDPTEQTYVEKRLVLGYSEVTINNTVSDFLRAIKNLPITQGMIDQINILFGTSFTVDNIVADLDSIIFENGYIKQEDFILYNDDFYYWIEPQYEVVEFEEKEELPNTKEEDFIVVDGSYYVYKNGRYQEIVYTEKDFVPFSLNVNDIINDILSFKKYIVNENVTYDDTQYAPLLKLTTELVLEDENGCGVSETIYGNMRIEPTPNAINNCKTNEKVFEFKANNTDNDNLVYYSIISIENGAVYPLNYAENNLLIKQINNEIKGVYGIGQEYNIFSYAMTSDYFRDGMNSIVDTAFASQTGETQDDETEVLTDTNGYGTTGHFTSSKNVPFYIVAETSNHCRAISPVYLYETVTASIRYGIVDGNKILGVAINNGHYYLDNFQYTLSCQDSVNNINIPKQQLNQPNQYVFTNISDELYNRLVGGTFTTDTLDITAIDCTGLKHICAVTGSITPGNWYSYNWVLDIPDSQIPSINTCGILDGGNYVGSKQYTYVNGETNIAIPQVYVAPNFGYRLEGWYDETNQKVVDGDGSPMASFPSAVSSNRTFTAQFEVDGTPVQTYTVTWCDETE